MHCSLHNEGQSVTHTLLNSSNASQQSSIVQSSSSIATAQNISQSTSFSNNSLYFDGKDDHLLVSDFKNLGTQNFTLEAWVKITSTVGVGNKIINKGLSSVGTPSNAGFALRTNKTSPDEIEFQMGHSDGTTARVLFNYTEFDIRKWIHIAGVRDGTHLMLYLNGTLVAEQTTSVIFNVDTDLPFTLGSIHKGGHSQTNEYLTGYIDEVRIWNNARTAEQINATLHCSIDTQDPNILIGFNFSESIHPYSSVNGTQYTTLFEGGTAELFSGYSVDRCLAW